jgi:hypothetical protein
VAVYISPRSPDEKWALRIVFIVTGGERRLGRRAWVVATAAMLVVVLLAARVARSGGAAASSVEATFDAMERDMLAGWRMVDRFDGFRFEVAGPNVLERSVRYLETAQALADELFCFGWVQRSKARGTVVGEARCNRDAGPRLREWLRGGPPGAVVDEVVFRSYDDTKIKLHFSHFKIVEAQRPTCFPDAPHQCAAAAAAARAEL